MYHHILCEKKREKKWKSEEKKLTFQSSIIKSRMIHERNTHKNYSGFYFEFFSFFSLEKTNITLIILYRFNGPIYIKYLNLVLRLQIFCCCVRLVLHKHTLYHHIIQYSSNLDIFCFYFLSNGDFNSMIAVFSFRFIFVVVFVWKISGNKDVLHICV